MLNNFDSTYTFTQPLGHGQDMTQGQVLKITWLYISPSPSPRAGCDTRSIFKGYIRIYFPFTFSKGKMWHKVNF